MEERKVKAERKVFGGLRYPKQEIKEVTEICCDAWNENVNQPVELKTDGLAINGCCGGGCYVIVGIKHCPFCGKKLFKCMTKR